MSARRRAGGLVLVVAVAAAAACRTAPVHDVSSSVPPDLTQKQVHDAIVVAAARRHWVARDQGPGEILATIDVRGKHSADVQIRYDASHYTIQYRDSENLKYRDGEIHKNYNAWVIKLDRTIRAELLRLIRSSAREGAS